jgi:hypothetical protein
MKDFFTPVDLQIMNPEQQRQYNLEQNHKAKEDNEMTELAENRRLNHEQE